MKTSYWLRKTMILLLLTGGEGLAQKMIDVGIRTGGTATHGNTVVPPQSTPDGAQSPELRNRHDGIGLGYTAGLWVRKRLKSFYLQAGIDYNSYLLKQKAAIDRIDVRTLTAYGVVLPVMVPPGVLFAQLNLKSESMLNALSVPVYIGKSWKEGKFRLYVGPNFLFIQKAKANRTVSGELESSSSFPIPGPFRTIAERTDQVNLLDKEEAGVLNVKPFTFTVEVGVGMTLHRNLELDFQYALPLGGVYNEHGITGFIGMANLTVGYRLTSF